VTPAASPALAVLDLVPVRAGQTSADAVAASLALASRADELGLRRYWFAEHHNMPAVASTTPPVLIAAAATRTRRIRVGSGGVMLPNHAPLVVAEQFAALEALAPGRIDLGIGRAPGSDPVVTQLLRMSGTTSDVERFPDHIRDIRAIVSPEGATIEFASGGTYDVHATPAATAAPEVWLLGSSDYSAQLAAALGLPYVFANHFSGEGLERALALYRGQFRPTAEHPEPRTFLTVNAVAAPTAEEAEERALPQLRMMARAAPARAWWRWAGGGGGRAGAGSGGVAGWMGGPARGRGVGGGGGGAAAGGGGSARRWEVDEIMISPVAGSYDAEPMDASPGRAQTLELVASALG